MKKVTLQISDEFFEFAKLRAEDDEYFGLADYLNGLLNMALLSAIDEFEENGPLRLPLTPPDKEPDWLDELEEDEGGGMGLKSDRGDSDLDDDLPF